MSLLLGAYPPLHMVITGSETLNSSCLSPVSLMSFPLLLHDMTISAVDEEDNEETDTNARQGRRASSGSSSNQVLVERGLMRSENTSRL